MASSSACAVGSLRWMVSLWASASVSPSATITAPIGTSSRTEAARASRSAACIPARSLGDGVPLRTGALGRGGRPDEAQVLARPLHPDGIALVEFALEQLERDRVLELALNDPLERPRAVHRIVALCGQQLLGLGSDLQAKSTGREQVLEVPELDVHDVDQVLPAERPEHDDVVHPIEELRAEEVAELVSHPLLDPAPRVAVGLPARVHDDLTPDVAG